MQANVTVHSGLRLNSSPTCWKSRLTAVTTRLSQKTAPAKAYMDLEAETGAMSAEEGKAMCQAVIREWNRRVRERWPVAVRECSQCQAHMLLHGSRNAGNGLKISYHIIFPWLVFPCNNGALREVIVTMSSMPEFQYRTQTGTLKPFIDPGVYTRNRQFRLQLNYKLPDRTRTALQLSQHPTLGMFVRACITQIQERAWSHLSRQPWSIQFLQRRPGKPIPHANPAQPHPALLH